RRAVRMIADEPCAVRELHDRSHLMEARSLRVPADARQSAEIGETGLLAESDSAGRRAHAHPDVDRVAFVARTAREQYFTGRNIEFQLQIRVADGIGRRRMLPSLRGLLPVLLEEQRGPLRFWPGTAWRASARRARARGVRGRLRIREWNRRAQRR